MGDRTYTSIEFSGAISEEQADELVELLEAQGCETNSGQSLLEGLKDPDGDFFYDSECNYAQMEDIEAWCIENDVSYRKSWSAGGDYGPGIEIWKHGMGTALQCASVEDSPVAELTELEKAHKAGKVDELIASLNQFISVGPPLQVLNVEDWTPEICVMMAKRKLEVRDEPAQAA